MSSRGKICKMSEVNNEVSCELCAGYLIDATTMIECPASFEGCPWLSNSDAFCRSCLFKHLYGQNGRDKTRTCPVCKKEIEQDKLGNAVKLMRSDNTLQDLVYKLVPGLYRSELKRRRDFYDELCKKQKGKKGAKNEDLKIFDRHLVELAAFICTPDELISLSLECESPPEDTDKQKCDDSSDSKKSPKESKEDKKEKDKKKKDVHKDTLEIFPKRYFRCPAAVKICHLKKLLQHRLELPSNRLVCLSYKGEILDESLSLMDLAYIFSWTRKEPMQLFYSLFRLEVEGQDEASPEQMPMLERESTPVSTAQQTGSGSVIPDQPTFAAPKPPPPLVKKQPKSESTVSVPIVTSTSHTVASVVTGRVGSDRVTGAPILQTRASTGQHPLMQQMPLLQSTPVSLKSTPAVTTPISTPVVMAKPSVPPPVPAVPIQKPKPARAKKSVDTKTKIVTKAVVYPKPPEPRKTADSTGEMLMGMKMARMAACEVADLMHMDHMARLAKEEGSKEGTPRLVIDTSDESSTNSLDSCKIRHDDCTSAAKSPGCTSAISVISPCGSASSSSIMNPNSQNTVISPQMGLALGLGLASGPPKLPPEASPNRRKRQMAPPKKKLKHPYYADEYDMDTNFNSTPILKSALTSMAALASTPSPLPISMPMATTSSSIFPSSSHFTPLFRPPLAASASPINSSSSNSPKMPILAPTAPPRLLPRPGIIPNTQIGSFTSRQNSTGLSGFLVNGNSIQLAALVNTNNNYCR